MTWPWDEGANMDFDRLRFVSERADSNETLMSVGIPEQPGAFLQLYALLYPRNVTEFSYRHNGTSQANIIVSLQGLSGKDVADDRSVVITLLQSSGFSVTDLSNNELAKAHARHLAGGRIVHPSVLGGLEGTESNRDEVGRTSTIGTAEGDDSTSSRSSSNHRGDTEDFVELVYRFEFPEAPGALNKFLTTIKSFNQVALYVHFHHFTHIVATL